MVTPDAVTVLVKFPQKEFVTNFVRVATPPGDSEAMVPTLPEGLSETMMLVMVTVPQLETTAVTRLGWPATTVLQDLVTQMRGVIVNPHEALDCAATGVPQTLVPLTINKFPTGTTPGVAIAQEFVTSFVRVAEPPGAKEAMVPMLP
jgi:hypothetical protein